MSRARQIIVALVALAVSSQALARSWPRGHVFVPGEMFRTKSRLDKVVLESNPRLYLHPTFDPRSDLILVIGMPGWGGRLENFIGCLYNGLTDGDLKRRLVLAAIQDPRTRGPRYQGQGEVRHANVWSLDDRSVPALRHFVQRLSDHLGHLRVYLLGFSSGSPSASLAAVRVALLGPSKRFVVEGAVSLGTGSPVDAKKLKANKQRVLFLVAPKTLRKEVKARRYDQAKRAQAEVAQARLASNGAVTYLRHIESARRHLDWHWGLISQCRYFKEGRHDSGRGYWPNYWMPNPETFGYVAAFVQGKAPPERLSIPPSRCPYAPNPNNRADPDARVRDPGRQALWAPGTVSSSKQGRIH